MKILHNFDASIILKYCVPYGLDKFLNFLIRQFRLGSLEQITLEKLN